MSTLSSLEEMIAALRCLPGVGPKSAQRMAYHLLQRDKPGALRLARALGHAVESIHHCAKCNNFSEEEICALCRSSKRDASLLCVVEMPADLLMMEQAQCYRGMYFVLMGRLSPLDGIGPRELHLDGPEREEHPNCNENAPHDEGRYPGLGDFRKEPLIQCGTDHEKQVWQEDEEESARGDQGDDARPGAVLCLGPV